MPRWKRKSNGEKSRSSIPNFQLAVPDDHCLSAGPRAISSYQELLDLPIARKGHAAGRKWAGKSTLLMLIKNSLSERAFFLPTQNQLSFLSQTNKYSTGESLRNRLIEILGSRGCDVFFLTSGMPIGPGKQGKPFPCSSTSFLKKNASLKCVIGKTLFIRGESL